MEPEAFFRGKTCVVTGAAAGIGYALAAEVLRAEARVFLADRDAERLAAAADAFREHGERVRTAVVDVTRDEEVQALLQRAVSEGGRIDVLFNNAGVGHGGPFEDSTLEHWRRILDVNVWSVIYGVRAALPLMRRQGGGGVIVNTSSLAGLVPIPYQAPYCTTKYAIVGLSECLRYELAPEGIHVAVVCPGAVVSRIWSTSMFGEHHDAKPPPDAIPAEDAARAIVAGVARKDGIIVLPEASRAAWRRYWSSPEEFESALVELARERRHAIETGAPPYGAGSDE
ncbi:MAG: SDR family oxidoreductase [Polyangiaceae bacterium]|nr:SDR family oxidoreductase [Polyangiaceae bacterium]